MNISEAIKSSKRGSLKYNREQPSKRFLDECSPPPAISSRFENNKRSPLNRQAISNQINQQNYRRTDSNGSGSHYDNFSEQSEKSDVSSEKTVEVTSPNNNTRGHHCITPVSPEYTKSVKCIKDYEEDLEKQKQMKVYNKQKEFLHHSKKLQNDAENKLKAIQRRLEEEAEERQQETELQIMQDSIEVQEKQRKLREDHRQHAQMLQRKHEKLKEEVKRKEKERQDRILLAEKIINDVGTIHDRIKTMHDQFIQKDRLPDALKNGLGLVRTKHEELHQMSVKGFSDQDIPKMSETMKLCLNAYEFMKKEYDEATKKIKEEMAKAEQQKAQEEAEKKAEAEARARAAATATLPPQTPGLATGPLAASTPAPASSAASEGAEGVLRCVDERALAEYTKLQDQLKKAEEESKTLFNNPQLKKMKFDIQKSVNTPINNISPVSGDHLRDKLQRLLNLLSGQTVDLSGKRFSLAGCPQALPFCKNLIGKMIVKKGEEQVSSKHQSAFAIASVTVGLIVEHPDILPPLLGYFHQLCPYTVPYHITKADGQSMEDYLKALGYKYDSDGNAEKQDQFLKRMSGIMRLYASIMVSHPPRGHNPFGPENAWAWLAMVMNIEPLPDITTTMIFDLLEVTGHALYRDYKKQFFKLLHILIKDFLPKLKRVSSPSGAGPMTRLEDFLQNSVKNNGNIPPPEGLLSAHFWMS